MFIIILASIGLAISMYSYLIEQKLKKEPNYKPACDLSDKISCTKPMRSQYTNLLYFSNALIGAFQYAVIIALAYFHLTHLLLLAAIANCIASVGLAYLLYFKIRSFCLLCVSLYIVNFLILVLVLYKL